MMYQGGKTKIAKKVAAAIASNRGERNTYIEPFLGSAAVFALVAPTFDRAVGTDMQRDLMMMWRDAVAGWKAPYTLTEDEYRAYRDDPEPSAMRAFAAYPCSFAGKRFGGYARDPKATVNQFPRRGAQSIERRAAALRGSPGTVELYPADYRHPYIDHLVTEDAVVYCDPPYVNTLKYRGTDAFDHVEFWDVMRTWSDRGAMVLVSEYTAPGDWTSALDIERHVSTALDNSGSRAVDRIFMRKSPDLLRAAMVNDWERRSPSDLDRAFAVDALSRLREGETEESIALNQGLPLEYVRWLLALATWPLVR